MAARLLRPSSSSLVSPTATAASRPLPTSLFRLPQLVRTMASASTKTEWLTVVPDKPNTLAKRLEVRPTHFANLEATFKSGDLKFGGAILHDVPSDPADPKTFDFAGSSLIVLAEKKSDVIDLLKKDVYYREGVWDVDNAQIYALKTAFRIP